MLVRITALVPLLFLTASATADDEPATPLARAAAEAYLATAEVIELETFDTKGITRPRKATLRAGDVTKHALFKTIDTVHVKERLSSGRTVFNLKDSYRHEIAAYELDKLLGVGIVPPTVERRIGRDRGSLQLWVEGAMTEWERRQVDELAPPDMAAWNDQVSTVKLFQQLIWDTDFNNISNVLVDPSWKIWKIDSSRAFRTDATLRREESLNRFSRRLLGALRTVDRHRLEKAVGRWLDRRQIEGLWVRRCRILELADEREAAFGEPAFYD